MDSDSYYSYSVFPVTSLEFTILGEIFAYVSIFQSSQRGSHIPSSWKVHTGFLLLAFAHLGHEYQDLLSPCDEMHVCTD